MEGVPVQFSDGVMIPWGTRGGVQAVGSESGGRLFVWRDGRAPLVQTYGRRIDGDGSLGPEELMGGELETIVAYSTQPGLTFVTTNDSTTVLNSDGSRSLNRVASHRFRLPHSLASDLSLYAVNDTGLVYYARCFDSLPTRVVNLPSVWESSWKLRSVSLSVSDSVHIYYGVWRSSQIAFMHLVVADSGALTPIEVYRTNYQAEPKERYPLSRVSITAYDRAQPCGNGTVFTIIRLYEYYGGSYPYLAYTSSERFLASDSGLFSKLVSSPSISCAVPSRYSISRMFKADSSLVRVVVDGNNIDIGVGASRVVRNRLQMTPSIMIRVDSVLVAWQNDSIDGEIRLGMWIQTPNDTVVPTASVGVARLTLFPTPEMMVAVRGGLMDALGLFGDASTVGYFEIRGVRRGLFALLSSGRSASFGRPYYKGRIVDVTSNPNTSEVLIGTGITPNIETYPIPAYQYYFTRVTKDGAIVVPRDTTLLGDIGNVNLVPIDDSTLAVIRDSTVWIRRNGVTIDTVHLPSTPLSAEYQRLHGDRFVQWHFADSARRRLMFQTFSTSGISLDTGSVTSASAISDVYIIPDRRDSGFILLHCGQGLHVARFSKTLGPAMHDTVVVTSRFAATPTGVMKGDTLLLVWQDIGDGDGKDVYGMRLPLGKSPYAAGTVHGPGSSRRGIPSDRMTITPNPGHDIVTVSYQLKTDGPVRVDAINVVGQVVLSCSYVWRDSGVYSDQLDVSGLFPGAYFIRILDQQGMRVKRLIALP